MPENKNETPVKGGAWFAFRDGALQCVSLDEEQPVHNIA